MKVKGRPLPFVASKVPMDHVQDTSGIEGGDARGLGDFVGDERKIKQILLNLLSNAVKLTPREDGSEFTPGRLMGL